ncbi:ubiquinone/menaquinone biosynthesis C-methylase UbiE [Mucilaginibacter gracilis]|uniref:Ubiquinone/menaquinone biosynthesis C-methylase UbiE n=1 Tax=Mucilaginibacter gracilis TaxID=423350 RepID=A0A495J3J5_9SPHI|nr:methyltransferase domain-containing protein [Mucilaginibacter gracilis]RKR83540.1 ubiquinone/menaquinone biosynthesis C-methylase UbiE [Mucilaginibacter gracilis]
MIQTIKNLIKYQSVSIPDKAADEAYNLWAENYDDQPDNLMFYLDQLVFNEFMPDIELRGKVIADMGCGTGRHWPFLFQNKPAKLTGYDISEGMLKRLKLKFPDANTVKITDSILSNVEDATHNFVLSTLTVAHIQNIEEALQEWARILKPGGDMIITDFHPKALAAGGKRTFEYHNEHIPIVNYVHDTELIKRILLDNGLILVNEVEKVIDNTVMHYYIKQNAIHVYQKFRGMPMIYGLHFKKL